MLNHLLLAFTLAAAHPAPTPDAVAFSCVVDGIPQTSDASTKYRPLPPKYPLKQRARGITGTVRIGIKIDDTGRVVELKVANSSGNKHLDAAALQSAAQWEFNPGCRNGKPVGAQLHTDIGFHL